ncbi:MAG TPA: glycine dehydrogenase (aminomethyl-transferring), partial [Bacteroidales bacterium]|nr:glycine dehydrogenase (aminomethyl-transferring) [Bacteroidales bacterium]
MIKDDFTLRHNGPQPEDVDKMLQTIGVATLDELIDKTIPASIRLKEDLPLPEGMTEGQYLAHVKELFAKNKMYKSYIGMGYYNTFTPGVILRNITENPGWYTAYTPYQAEISQGRLEALLNYQTMVSDLTGMPIANASMLDEATAAGEMMLMFFNSRKRDAVKNGVNKYFVSNDVFPQTLAVIQTNAKPQGIEVVTGDPFKTTIDETFFGVMVQYPCSWGEVVNYRNFAADMKAKGIFVGVASDLLALTLLTPPGEWGADCVIGTAQRFGTQMGFGGPHAGFFACIDDMKRQMPGRIIGVTIDAHGNKALRMALQTREQHIKREKATSNICTASALSAITAGFYAMWHGPKGLKDKATKINILAGILADEAVKLGYKNHNPYFFDTICLQVPEGMKTEAVQKVALAHNMNFYYWCDECISISLDETVLLEDVNAIIEVLAIAVNKPFTPFVCVDNGTIPPYRIQEDLTRTSTYLTHAIFSKYHSETEMMRYMKLLEIKDLSLNRAMIPLGSCTMKLNAAAEMFPLSWPEVGAIHPFAPADQVEGYTEMIKEMDQWLSIITGFKAISFQPNSGAAGEYA